MQAEISISRHEVSRYLQLNFKSFSKIICASVCTGVYVCVCKEREGGKEIGEKKPTW